MHKVDGYLLKNSLYLLLLANILALLLGGGQLFFWLNAVALGLCLLLLFLIRLTVGRYAVEFGKERTAVKNLLGEYIEDDQRGKLSFHDYLRQRVTRLTGES